MLRSFPPKLYKVKLMAHVTATEHLRCIRDNTDFHPLHRILCSWSSINHAVHCMIEPWTQHSIIEVHSVEHSAQLPIVLACWQMLWNVWPVFAQTWIRLTCGVLESARAMVRSQKIAAKAIAPVHSKVLMSLNHPMWARSQPWALDPKSEQLYHW